VKVVLRQVADEARSVEDDRQGVDDRALPGPIGTHEDIVTPEPDGRVLNPAKAIDRE
jgi:hypothetical protein